MWSVRNDVGELKAGIIYDGGPEVLWTLNMIGGDHPLVYSTYYNEEEIKGLTKDLKEVHGIMRDNTSAKLFDLKELLRETLDEYRDDKKILEDIMKTLFPPLEDWERLKKMLGDRWKELNAGEVFGEHCPFVKHNGVYRIGIRPGGRDIVNTRDLGVMTSRGFFLCHKFRWGRSCEDNIIKAVMLYHPVIKENVDLRINFHAKEMMLKGCFIEGGDCTIPSEDSVAVGLNYHSKREAIIELSKAFPDLTIYGVHMYPWDKSINYAYHWAFHWDATFVMIDDNACLTIPYIFDRPRPGRKFLVEALEIIRRDIDEWHPLLRTYREAGKEIPQWWKNWIYGDLEEWKTALIYGIGRTEVFKRGELVARKDSILDALIDDGILEPDNIIYVGGNPDDYDNEFEYLFRALKEGAAANCMVALRPKVLIAYEENVRTIEALKDFGCKVFTVKGHYMQKVGGMGTHCSIMPLWRT